MTQFFLKAAKTLSVYENGYFLEYAVYANYNKNIQFNKRKNVLNFLKKRLSPHPLYGHVKQREGRNILF